MKMGPFCPPATNTCPFESRGAVCWSRAACRLPVLVQVPLAGVYGSAVGRQPLLPAGDQQVPVLQEGGGVLVAGSRHAAGGGPAAGGGVVQFRAGERAGAAGDEDLAVGEQGGAGIVPGGVQAAGGGPGARGGVVQCRAGAPGARAQHLGGGGEGGRGGAHGGTQAGREQRGGRERGDCCVGRQ